MSKKNFLSSVTSFFGASLRLERAEVEKARLQAFLNAFPGEYCGLGRVGEAVYSPGFCDVLGLERIQGLADIQAVLSPGDSAALEGMMDRLRENSVPFTLIAHSLDDKHVYKISGARGTDLSQRDAYDVLWVEDLTEETREHRKNAEQSHEIEQQFNQIRVALDSLPRPVWLRDTEQNLIWVNTTYCEYLGKERVDILTQQVQITAGAAKRKSGDKNDAQLGKELAAQALKTGQAADSKMHGIFHGKRLLLRISEIPLTSLGMTLGISYNITREEELESELKRFQLSTNELLEHLGSAIAIFDSEQGLEFYNVAFTELWGLEAGWLDGHPKLGVIMEQLRQDRRLPEQADFKSFKQSWLDMFTNLIRPEEDMLYLPNGTALRMLVVPHSMGGLMMTFEDVTSRLALESSYNTLMAVQRETLDNLAEGVAVYGGDGRLKLWNPAFANIWRLNPEDLDGEPHINRITDKKKAFFDEDSWPDYRKNMIALALERQSVEMRIHCVVPDVEDQSLLLDMATVPLPDGGVLITYADVTSKVEIENALREKAQALEAAEQLKLDFLANVSYQLRTPLSTIMGFADILKEEYFGGLNDRQKEYTVDIRKAADRLLDLINDILDLSTLEAGYLTLERTEFKVCDMLGRVNDLVTDWARKEQIQVQIICPDNVGSVNADERRLQQALINLVRNAIAYTSDGGDITIKASRKKAALHITVSDTGIGISQDDKMRIFEPFERAKGGNNSRLMRTGTGIGLSLVQRIIEAHGGSVDLQSMPGKGTDVTLIIPLTSTKVSFKVPVQKEIIS